MTSASSSTCGRRVCLHWFRKGLRLADNPALDRALQATATDQADLDFRAVFVLDPWFAKRANVGVNRWRFLRQSLLDLDEQLRQRGNRLFVVRGRPADVMGKLFKEWKVALLTYEADIEPYALKRDKEVTALAKRAGVQVVACVSHTLYDPEAIVAHCGGRPPLVYRSVLKAIEKLGRPAKAIPAPAAERLAATKPSDDSCLDDGQCEVPTLAELGVDEAELEPCLYPGGEREGLKRLNRLISSSNAGWVRNFEKPATSPNALQPSTTVLSPYLKFGCVSPRQCYWRLVEVLGAAKCSQPPVSLLGQLYWREFYYASAAGVGEHYDRMAGNSICKQIDWDVNAGYVKAWREARTGYPFVDAIMTQLRKEGWIHHLARHMVACFLTWGDLYVSWEEGDCGYSRGRLNADSFQA